MRRRPETWLWALRDVSFDIQHGEVVGIIGRNGAGKSTLLKVLSRITEPTEGHAAVHGRVGSLLEVGTGFHPELTGRENMYLNAAILGMRRAEIDRRFDEIVSFAGTERFLDTPVKHYSSGMQMRLAFAVAAHLEAEILLVDEVLAVGDLEFQRKCLGKMQEVSRTGRTVLFVSHNLQAIRLLCRTAMLLHEGRVVASGAVDDVVTEYLRTAAGPEVNTQVTPAMHQIEPIHFELTAIELLDQHDEPASSLLMDEAFAIRVSFRIHDPSREYRIGLWIRTAEGVRLASFISTENGLPHIRGRQGVIYQAVLRSRNLLPPGSYLLDVNVKSRFDEWVDQIQGVAFTVEPVSVTSEPHTVAKSEGATWGLIRLPFDWQLPEEA